MLWILRQKRQVMPRSFVAADRFERHSLNRAGETFHQQHGPLGQREIRRKLPLADRRVGLNQVLSVQVSNLLNFTLKPGSNSQPPNLNLIKTCIVNVHCKTCIIFKLVHKLTKIFFVSMLNFSKFLLELLA